MRVPQWIVVSLVLVLLAVGVVLGLRHALHGTRITVQGVELRRLGEVRFLHAHIADDDPTVLVVEAGEGYPGPPRPCRTWTTARLLSQDDRSLRVRTDSYRTVDGGTGACTLEGYGLAKLRVPLGRPLGGRTVYDGDSPIPVRVIDPKDLLRLGSVPAGYRRPALSIGNPTDRTDDDNPFALWTYPGSKQSAIEVYQGKPLHGPGPIGDALADIEQVRSRPTVRGHSGVVHQAKHFNDVVCLRWQERADLVISVCSRGNPAPLSDQQLVRLAETLRTS